MRKKISFLLLIFSFIGFSAPMKDDRGVLIMESSEWIKFYNNSGFEIEMCAIIGSLIMEESYIRDGKKMGHSLEENKEIIKELNRDFSETGLRDINGSTDSIHEFYYASVCKRPTLQDYNLVGSPNFRTTMERIFRTNTPK